MNNSHFSHCGPVHLTVGDWTNPNRKRCMASLVEEVYRLEYCRQGKPHEPQADLATWRNFFDESQGDRASPWRDLFHEPKGDRVIREDNGVIIGAIFEYKNIPRNPNVPRYVIAFRGIIKKLGAIVNGELTSAVKCMLNEHERSSRLQLAMDAVQERVASAGDPNHVWLAGHSLGAAIALYVGKKMAKKGFLLDNTYLFNPPFLGFSAEPMKNGKRKKWVPVVVSFVKAGAAVLVGQHSDPFAGLYNWFPHLFVNQGDHICSGYITYFQNRVLMTEKGFRKIERRAAKISITSLFSDSEALHLLPSAYLTINTGSTPGFRRAHGNAQWLDPSFSDEPKKYDFDDLY